MEAAHLAALGVQQLAPTGTHRAAINLSNFPLVSGRDDTRGHTGSRLTCHPPFLCRQPVTLVTSVSDGPVRRSTRQSPHKRFNVRFRE